ncbi:NADP-dependent oxidoreductase [Solihabitans fulvus]|uniref:NADP-dependent oxidoreductase n=1 Tax=Solihabitans fulvus TaxID=1892852 RepID=A0A5B2WUK9_9PSEU|nr:NADP-dependent oxidoreductase [Solihabitans fulvus]KAA2254099.1 NADP-dependent oxidoreductase [Solihabitans fulvus]
MRAVVVRSFGGPEVLEIANVAVPAPGRGQVRIRMTAASVNPVDLATRSGALTEAGLVEPREVLGIGWDVAGEIDALGQETTGFSLGDNVIGLSDRFDVSLGTHAEYVVLDASAVALAPRGTPATEAATLPLNGLTARQALDVVGLGPGQTLLVTGAAGAVGGFAVQLAVARGLRVVAVAGARDEALVRSLGAEFFVPRNASLADAVREFVPGGTHGVIDAAVLGVRALSAVRGGGAFVSVVAGGTPVPLRGVRVSAVWTRADGTQLAELVKLVEADAVTLRVANVHPLAEVALAHERLGRGGLRGRLVLVP